MKQSGTLQILSVALLLVFSTLSYGHTGSIKGFISDLAAQKPLEGVGIYLKEAGKSAVSDDLGGFMIKGIDAGQVTVYVSMPGYKSFSQLVSIEDGVTTDLVVYLDRENVRMSEVTINARKEMNLSTLSGIDLKSRPANSSQDLLRLVPGLFTSQHQGGGKAEQLFLRGFDADHGTDVNISVDGMPVNMVSHAHGQGFADTHFIIPESVQLLDFGKGPYQIDKGNLCTAGWVGFKTRNKLDDNFLKTEIGSYGYYRTVGGVNLLNVVEGKNKQVAYIIGEYGFNKGYFEKPQNFQRFNLLGKYTNYLSSNRFISFTVSGFSSDWNASGQLPSRAVAQGLISRYGSLSDEGGTTRRYNANLQYFQKVGADNYFKSNIWLSAYRFKLSSNFTFFLLDSINGDEIRQAETRLALGYNSEYTFNFKLFTLPFKTQIGSGLRYDQINNNELSHVINKDVLIDRIALGDIHETTIFSYLNQTVELTPRLVLNAGTRIDYLFQQYFNKLSGDNQPGESFGKLVASPKAGAYYSITDKARIYYNYGIGFHSNDTRTLAIGGIPAYKALFNTSVINNTLPMAFSQDLGVVFKPCSDLLLSIALWNLRLQQEFTYSGDESTVSPSGSTRRIGIDISARCDMFKWLYLDADINLSRARYIDSPTGNNYLPLAAGFTSIGGATFKFNKNLSAGIRFRVMGTRPATQDNEIKAPGYTLFDAVATYSRPKYELGIQIQNLTNAKWDEAAFATNTRLRSEVAAHIPGTTDLCVTPGTPIFLKLSASYKF